MDPRETYSHLWFSGFGGGGGSRPPVALMDQHMPYNVSTSFMTYMYAETDDIVITLHLYDSLICLFFSLNVQAYLRWHI